MLLHERYPNEDRYTTNRGVMVIQRPAPRVELISGHGFASEEFIAPILDSRDQTLAASGKLPSSTTWSASPATTLGSAWSSPHGHVST